MIRSLEAPRSAATEMDKVGALNIANTFRVNQLQDVLRQGEKTPSYHLSHCERWPYTLVHTHVAQLT
jgi:hypothetical protein